jgi:hypothetical protein
MIRREFLRKILYSGTALAAANAAKEVIAPLANASAAAAASDPQNQHQLPTPAATPFALEHIKILDPDLLRMRAQTLDYLLALDSDRLLHNFRITANLPSDADPLYNRESPTNGWRGHYGGHFRTHRRPLLQKRRALLLAASRPAPQLRYRRQ